MSSKSNFTTAVWFVPLVSILLAGLAIFGGLVVWKLVHSAKPQVAKAQIDPDQILEGTTAPIVPITQSTTQNAATGAKQPASTSTKTPEEDEFYGHDGYVHEGMKTEEPVAQEVLPEPAPQEPNILDKLGITQAEMDAMLDAALKREAAAKAAAKNGRKNTSSANRHMSYEQGIAKCRAEKFFPCAWEETAQTNQSLIKQFWMESAQGPIERVIHDADGNVVSRTVATLSGMIKSYKGAFAELYFEAGALSKIRTSPYDNPNWHDWFFIDGTGKLDVCMCAVTTKNCCDRSMFYREGGSRDYCSLFPRDVDFCKKK